MIFFFSATGNSEYVSNLLAEELHDETFNLLPLIKSNKPCAIKSETPFVLCFPSYICNVPLFLIDFFKRVTFVGNDNVYVMCTCASFIGITGETMHEIINSKGKIYRGCYTIPIANNYVISDRFKMTEPEDVIYRLEDAKLHVKRIALAIQNSRSIVDKKVPIAEKLTVKPVVSVYTKFMQSSKPFHVNNNCVGCGTCVKLCPVNKIHMGQDNRPVWSDSCMHCMSCIGNCPVEAIDYGDITTNKVKYNVKKYL